jgi:hypothetical protein
MTTFPELVKFIVALTPLVAPVFVIHVATAVVTNAVVATLVELSELTLVGAVNDPTKLPVVEFTVLDRTSPAWIPVLKLPLGANSVSRLGLYENRLPPSL